MSARTTRCSMCFMDRDKRFELECGAQLAKSTIMCFSASVVPANDVMMPWKNSATRFVDVKRLWTPCKTMVQRCDLNIVIKQLGQINKRPEDWSSMMSLCCQTQHLCTVFWAETKIWHDTCPLPLQSSTRRTTISRVRNLPFLVRFSKTIFRDNYVYTLRCINWCSV